MNLQFPKEPRWVRPEWTRAAQGQDCQLRLPGCNYDTSTTVFAHYRLFGWGATAMKPHDFLGCFACSHCHDKLDFRNLDGAWGYDDLLRAMGNTLRIHYMEGRL